MIAMTRVAAVLVLMGALVGSRPALAAPEDGSLWTLRLYGGLQNGAAAGVTSPGRMVTAELAQSFLPKSRLASLSEVALGLRTGGSGFWVGGRLGFQLGMFSYEGAASRDITLAVDAGIVGGVMSEGGHSFTIEAGAERVSRSQDYYCCDSTLSRDSLGARVMLTGQYAFRPDVAAFARLGLRTADHLKEIKMLPVLLAGVALQL
jgi:hypothetical protein